MATIYPVIMCGGSGTRLWPASRPSLPKQFIPLAGNRSLFQETVSRVAALAQKGQLVVVGGIGHRAAIQDQLDEIGVSAVILLEPEGRDSSAAMAAAALWTADRSQDAVNLFVASDHHIPDDEAFRKAVVTAAAAASEGRIVTLGVVPTEPSSAYGYIAPSGPGLSEVSAFVEKPDTETARRYIADGYLWNSGNFIVRADVLVEEIQRRAAAVNTAVRNGLGQADVDGDCLTLGSGFLAAPKISIDYAVMEKTSRASVLPVQFAWSDLGAWDSVHASGEGDVGLHVLEDSEGCLVRACDGVMVAAIGLRDVGIIVERDAVLVTDLKKSQDVKKVVERLRRLSPQHLDFPKAEPLETLNDGALRLTTWLRQAALPVWASLGQDRNGSFEEVLALDGRHVATARRARVQARQLQVYAEAGRQGWRGPWRATVDAGLESLAANYLRPDGQMRTVVAPDGSPIDETAMVYDQAFLMFALACASSATADYALQSKAAAVRDLLIKSADAEGGIKENGRHPYQSNAHMHLLEAALAWEEIGGDKAWSELADRIVGLARSRFMDVETGALREFFQSDWSPAAGEDGRLIEPGHQFEWAWLIARYGRRRGDAAAMKDAWRLYENGGRGVDLKRGIAVDAMNIDGGVRSGRARLWPQTEWLKASLILAELSDGSKRIECLDQAARAQRAVWRYLTPQGLWRDKLLENDDFIDEPAPASSFYHIMAAHGQLLATATAVGMANVESLRLV
ncbi:AGE family epimerase/isomerase [Brevundimonas sp. SORGH_AS_0993]|uniref:AGE family epimerase/isomerase n=1 Tax=Brevundimonas sp. SORGH_AS_0993 TaxID=3041794 RepID=UPI0027884279|nr:AGE family epimerase/isomerase [Brevundimonas sp. SORGH_AS_0993]MDQ1154791.1 mannose-1-phosphate guanylyltransferase/mannose-6-phosphate isomerase [Brevundimonas sp. SORGH_AS_0993]